jgi:hypothetical protein
MSIRPHGLLVHTLSSLAVLLEIDFHTLQAHYGEPTVYQRHWKFLTVLRLIRIGLAPQ